MYGTRDALINQVSTGYFIIEVNKCTNERILATDDFTECESTQNIFDWTYGKHVSMKILNNKADFNINASPTRNIEAYLPTIPIDLETFSDVGFRFKRNVFSM